MNNTITIKSHKKLAKSVVAFSNAASMEMNLYPPMCDKMRAELKHFRELRSRKFKSAMYWANK